MTKPAAKPSSTPPALKKAAAAKPGTSTAKAAPAPRTVQPVAKPHAAGAAISAPASIKPAKKAAVKVAPVASAPIPVKPAAKGAAKGAAKSVAKGTLAPVTKAAAKPVAQPAAKGPAKPTAKSAVKSVAKVAPAPVTKAAARPVAKAVAKPALAPALARLTLSSRNYSSWSLRGYLMAKFAGLKVEEVMVAPDDPDSRAELLLLSPSILVPMLEHEGLKIWDVMAIGEYLAERFPEAGLLPLDPLARARCRSICGEIHSGFASLRAALPVNLRMRHSQFKVWSRAQADIDRIFTIWHECLAQSGGPFLFGKRSLADAMYAPVVTRLRTYDVPVPPGLTGYCGTILSMPEMLAWEADALAEPDQLQEFDVEF